MKPLLVNVLIVAIGTPLCSQESRQKEDPLAQAKVALSDWVVAKDKSETQLEKTVSRVIAAKRPGLRLLATMLEESGAGTDKKRIQALDSMLCHVALRWFDKVEKSGMLYAGQFNDLLVLQPRVGEFYLGLLLDTPSWFPINQRGKAVPALRDLFPKGPDKESLERIEAMANNKEEEPEALRFALAYALAQWGNRKLIKSEINALETKVKSDDEEVVVMALRDLAQIYYGIRDYGIAAVMYKDFLRRAEKAGSYLVPVYYYNAACCMSLSGDRRSALDYLKRSLQLNKSDRIDSSMRLERSLFEKDPEIALVRRSKGFAELLDQAFGTRNKDKNKHR